MVEVEAGGWRLEAGGWRLEAGGWRQEAGGCFFEQGCFDVEAGIHLAFGLLGLWVLAAPSLAPRPGSVGGFEAPRVAASRLSETASLEVGALPASAPPFSSSASSRG